MRRRRKTGPRKGKGKEVTGTESISVGEPEEGVSASTPGLGEEMGVTAMDVVETRTHQHFGHGHHQQHHHHLHSGGSRQGETEMDSGHTTQNNKAVGARKRKTTQISKIVEKPISSEPENGPDENEYNNCSSESPPLHNNNNNSPPYKKPHMQMLPVAGGGGERNGMIQNIVTELKSAKKASSQLESLFPKNPSHSTLDGDFSSGGSSDEEDENSLRIEVEEDLGGRKYGTNKRRGEEKVNLANIRTLLSSNTIRSDGDEDEDEDDGMDAAGKEGNESEAEDGDHQQLPFRCGVCRFGTMDRTVLVRHMRSHSGDRSFQCRLCSFAFTTKANCERHLRNRHGQIDKDQIRNLVVVFSSSSESETETNGPSVRSPSSSSIPINKNTTSGGLLLQQHRQKQNAEDGHLNLSVGRYEGLPRGTKLEPAPRPLIPLVTTAEDEQPLDLSMDAVDLSTKARNGPIREVRSSLLRPRPIYPTTEIPNLLVTSPFVTKREAMVHPQLSLQMMGDEQYNSLFNGYSPFSTNPIRAPDLNGPTTPAVPQPFSLFPFGGTPPYNPFSFPTPTMDKVGPVGPPGLISNHVGNIPPSSKGTSAFMAPSPPTSFESLPGSLEKEIKLKSTKKEPKTQITESSSISSISPSTTSRKRADVKNGEYQKPKQRRYRTERPFSCPHCPARFTLRSNMERHGKHQHPNVWQRSPSNRVINRQQKNQQSPLAGPPTMVHPNKYSNLPSGIEMKGKGRGSGSVLNGEGIDIRAVIAQQLKRKLSNSALLNNGTSSAGVESDTDSENTTGGAEGGRSGHDSSDLASVSQLLDRVKNSNIAQYFHVQGTARSVANSDSNNEKEDDMSGTESSDEGSGDEEGEMDETEEVNDDNGDEKVKEGREKKKSAYSSAPHKISCPHCTRRFPWHSSLRRHLLTHTGQKPYQCSKCPLLFTTKSNCDRHLARKHSGRKGKNVMTGSGYNTTEDDDDEGEEEGRIHEEDEDGDEGEEDPGEETEKIDPIVTPPRSSTTATQNKSSANSANSSPGEDVSFRCHLCEAAATEREVLLTHMEEEHKETFHLLVSKGALTTSPPSENSEAEPRPNTPAGDPKEVTHRKVMCVFCVRRFWSVEDLRRHIRSHSGERPFTCTHCSRRFTLKHSMLRHLKKHLGEDAPVPQQTPRVRREALSKKRQRSKGKEPVDGEETNLISRLLGIHDEGLVEQLLSKPDAKDAAKLLGLRVGLARQNTSLTSSN